jgi:hypothetical protein
MPGRTALRTILTGPEAPAVTEEILYFFYFFLSRILTASSWISFISSGERVLGISLLSYQSQ